MVGDRCASHPLCAVSFTLTEYFVRASWLFGLLPRWPWPWSHRTGDQHQPTQVTDHKPQLGSQPLPLYISTRSRDTFSHTS